MARYAEVAVNAGQPLRMAFTYEIPAGLDVRTGQAVFVPYGGRELQGIVLATDTTPPDIAEIRAIGAIADEEPVLSGEHIALARWISARYLAPLWECVALMLPAGYGQKPLVTVSPVEIPPLFPVYPRDQQVLRYLAAHGQVTLDTLRKVVPGLTTQRLERLQAEGYLTVVQGLQRPRGRPKFERYVTLLREAEEAAAAAEELEARRRTADARLLRLLAVVREAGPGQIHDLRISAQNLDRLAAEGWLEVGVRQVERDPVRALTYAERPPLALTPSQAAAVEAIEADERPFLVHGITGSGKTEVYLELVRRTLARGKGAILLVPEISLTPQAVRRYGERFGETLTVFHSELSVGERFDQWHRVQRGEARVVVGSRSAIFAPVAELGLVVIDEEHEWTYKQEAVPRYHARAVAEELCRLTGARLVLGSATPDVVTYHRAELGQFGRVELLERVVPVGDGTTRTGELPRVFVVDMRDELRAGNRGVFSFVLGRAVRTALQRGEQSILFVNRRGGARFLLCRECGHVPLCSSCQVAYSLDARDGAHPRLLCHHCGRGRPLEERCPKCGSARYRPFGAGTQRIEAEARAAFPGARIARWDSQMASKKGSHERLLAAVEAHEIDILVGTQMLAKGLDLPAMTVVGVVDADVGLNLPDYTAAERTFQLMAQVAGRAGRRERPGWVYIQTYQPESEAIQAAARHDYGSFFAGELAHRRRAGYPPFSRLARLLYAHRNAERGLAEASRLAGELRVRRDIAGRGEPDILGPSPPYIPMLRGLHRWQIVLRGRDPAALIEEVRPGRGWMVDIDPVTLT